jgi:hypothetical protein
MGLVQTGFVQQHEEAHKTGQAARENSERRPVITVNASESQNREWIEDTHRYREILLKQSKDCKDSETAVPSFWANGTSLLRPLNCRVFLLCCRDSVNHDFRWDVIE